MPGVYTYDPTQMNHSGQIQLKWPPHPSEYGLAGAEKHKRWKDELLGIMKIKKVPEWEAAYYIKHTATGVVKRFFNDIPYQELDFQDMIKTLDFHFEGEPDDSAAKAEKEFLSTARRYGEPLREYIFRLEFNKKEYLRLETGSSVAPRRYAHQMLERSGLSKFDQRAILHKTEGIYDAEKFKQIMTTIYRRAEGGDTQRIVKGRNFRRGIRKTFIVCETEMEPDDVDDESQTMPVEK